MTTGYAEVRGRWRTMMMEAEPEVVMVRDFRRRVVGEQRKEVNKC